MSLSSTLSCKTIVAIALALLADAAQGVPLSSPSTSATVQLSPTLANKDLSTAPTVDINTTSPARFVTRKEPVEQLFKALGAEMHKTFRLSVKARPYRISGEFDLSQPFKVLERVTASLGLIWYYDGQIVYIYDGNEATSVILSTPPGTVDDLIAFLKSASLYDNRFPIKYTPGTGLVYLSAPPKYVEIVQSAAMMLRKQEHREQVDGGHDRRVEVVKLRHAFVADRNIARRDISGTVPGVGQVLSAIMGSGTVVDVSATRDQALSADPRAASDQLPTPSLPTGVPEMPPLGMMPPIVPPPATGSSTGPLIFPEPSVGGAAPPMRIVAYPANNSLLLEGTDAQIVMARRIIAQLDIPKEQVELSLWVIDIYKRDADTLGAEWSAVGRVGPIDVSFNRSVLDQGVTLSRAQTLRFIASITALSEQKKARIVSRPILLAQDNSPAVFDNSRSFYVKVYGERTATLHKITYGTMIDVVPHVVDTHGRIEMDLAIEDGNSSAPTADSHLEVPTVSSTKISTMARVQHEQSLLVGGYTLDETSENTRKIPLLGDIPVIGTLFTYTSNTGSQSVRLFLIQPRLLADDSSFDSKDVATPKEIDNAVDALRAQMRAHNG